MPCDQPFAQIEKIKQRKEFVFVPEEWCESLICFEQVFGCESRPRCDTWFHDASAAILKKVIKNKTASLTTNQYKNWFMKEGKSLYIMKRVIWCAASSVSLKQRRRLLILMHQKHTRMYCLGTQRSTMMWKWTRNLYCLFTWSGKMCLWLHTVA